MQFIVAIIMILGVGIIILFRDVGGLLIGGPWFILGLIGFLWGISILNNTKNSIAQYFSACPLCRSPNTLVKLGWSGIGDDTHEIICQQCGAKWKITTSGWTGKIKIVKLVKPSDDGTGLEYLSKETDPEFWITIPRKRKQ